LRLLAIDPSLNATGLAYTPAPPDMAITTDRIVVKNLRNLARLVFVRKAVEVYVDAVEPEMVIYEDYSYGSKGSSIFEIGEMGGQLKTLCYEKGIDILLVPPKTLKMFASGSGNADKPAMAEAVFTRWGRTFGNDDEVDAYALFRFGEAYLNVRKRRALSQKAKDSMAKCEVVTGRPLRRDATDCKSL
jgi:Holliday junction resolvasome RuvABC endonuclease subunit